VKDGLRTAVWKTDRKVRMFNVVAGKWAERKGEGTAIYYDPAHTYNIDELMLGLNGARKYFSAWFREYPWKELKLSEFPAMATYAQGFPTDTRSGGDSFLTRQERATPFTVAAHEAAPVVGNMLPLEGSRRRPHPRGWRTSRRSS
jgi:hypothetical protein